MLFSKVDFDNVGPIEILSHSFPTRDDGSPKPTIVVGANGSGKSILLSHLVNAVMTAFSVTYDDSELDRGKVFKLRSPSYINHGKLFSRSRAAFSNGKFVASIDAVKSKKEIEDDHGIASADALWKDIPNQESSGYNHNFPNKDANFTIELSQSAFLYFPANRFEEPAWLNERNLKGVAEYSRRSGIRGLSDRVVIQSAPLKKNQDWLLDVLFDFALERKERVIVTNDENGQAQMVPIGAVSNGPATDLVANINRFLQALFGVSNPVSFSLGARGQRMISVHTDGQIIANNLFSLSTGQTQLLNMFLSLIRDFDLASGSIQGLEKITGIVIVDEIDLHLHADMQRKLLPELISLFPKVQFIVTSHSPLFLLGMQERFGDGGFEILELPSGQLITAERFSEFDAAYNSFKETSKFETDLEQKVIESQKARLFLEGTTDIYYIRKAAELLEKNDLLSRFQLEDGTGSDQINKIEQAAKSKLANSLPFKVVGLYDGDTKKKPKNRGNIHIRVIPLQEQNTIKDGIENLFSDETIQKAIAHKQDFIDIKTTKESVRGETTETVSWSVNDDEKRNLCDWLCESGDKRDFEPFRVIFEMLEEIVGS